MICLRGFSSQDNQNLSNLRDDLELLALALLIDDEYLLV